MGIKNKKNNAMYRMGYLYKSDIERLLMVLQKILSKKGRGGRPHGSPLVWVKCVSGTPVVTYIASIAQLWPGYRYRKFCYKIDPLTKHKTLNCTKKIQFYKKKKDQDSILSILVTQFNFKFRVFWVLQSTVCCLLSIVCF